MLKADLTPLNSDYAVPSEKFEEIVIGIKKGKKREGVITGAASSFELEDKRRAHNQHQRMHIAMKASNFSASLNMPFLAPTAA